MSKKKLSVKIVKGVLRIEIGISTLKFAAEHYEGFYLPHTGKFGIVVKDEKEFAKEVAAELEHEQEDGSTPVHLLLDKAIDDAVNGGSQALDDDAMEALSDAERAYSSEGEGCE